jgi:hypothetical protein
MIALPAIRANYLRLGKKALANMLGFSYLPWKRVAEETPPC